MYYLNKIVGFLVSPIGGAIAGGVLAFVCVRWGRQRLAKWIGSLTIIWLWLWMTPAVMWIAGVPLEREFLVEGQVPVVESFPEADAIILLGGSMGIETNANACAEMWTSADRVWQAARLYKAGKAAKVIATGDSAKESTLPLLMALGVGEEAVSFLDARTTEEEAQGVAALWAAASIHRGDAATPCAPQGAKPKVLLVTSAWHMKRARLMFEKYAPGIDLVCAPADFENTFMVRHMSIFKVLLPDPNVFYLNSVAFHEWVGIVGYRVFR